MTRTFRHRRLIPRTLVGVTALALAATSPIAWGRDHRDKEIPFEEAEIFFELNNTDGDLGIHGKVDGGPWTYITIEDSKERELMYVKTKTRLRQQGVTELFFESAEPTFDELSPERFFRRFPEGTYEIEGKSQDGEELESETEVTHTMPAPADGIELTTTVDGIMFNTTEVDLDEVDCDDETSIPIVDNANTPVTISWDPVERSHPDLGSPKDMNLSEIPTVIVNYEVVVEHENDFVSIFSAIVPPDVTSMTIPSEFLELGDEFKYEILAREQSYNQTAVESCFVTE